MRLKSVKMAGFKSFADAVTVSFPGNLCSVVGPNGCGKSNIIDGIRWVLGESSAKQLRSGDMDDVIFAGSDSRKLAAQASVELLFDNSAGLGGGEYASYTEIHIRRELARDTQSRYFLNGQRCRRRDILSFLAGTGLGPQGYSVIEQGMISRLIEAKPETLRSLVEEAAGISLYKMRRQETEHRAHRVRANLRRHEDLRGELAQRAQHLQEQVREAELYRKTKAEEIAIKGQLLVLRWQVMTEQIERQERAIDKAREDLAVGKADLTAVDSRIAQQQVCREEQATHLDDIRQRIFQQRTETTRLEENLRARRERMAQLHADITANRKRQDSIAADLEQDREHGMSRQAQLDAVEVEWQEARRDDEAHREWLHKTETALSNWQQGWDEFAVRLAQLRQQSGIGRARRQQLQDRLAQLEENYGSLKAQEKLYRKDDLSRNLGSLEEALAAAQEERARLQQQHEELSNTQRRDAMRIKEAGARLHEGRQLLEAQKGRRASLQALQQHALGRADAGVNDWLSKHGIDDKARLGEQTRIRPGWEPALETVLGEFLQAIVLEELDDTIASRLQDLQGGHLNLLERPSVQDPSGEGAGYLADLLEQSGAAAPLLRGIRVAQSLQEALALRKNLHAHQSIVTDNGVWMGRHWIRVRRDRDDLAGILVRNRQLDELEQLIGDQTETVERQRRALETLQQADALVDEQRAQVQAKLSIMQTEYAEVHGEHRAMLARMDALTANRRRNAEELSGNRRQFREEQASLARIECELEADTRNLARMEEQEQTLLATRDKLQEDRSEMQRQALVRKDALHALSLRKQNLLAELKAAATAHARLGRILEDLRKQHGDLLTALQDTEEPLGKLDEELQAGLAQQAHAERRLQEQERQIREMDDALHALGKKRTVADAQVHECRLALETMTSRYQNSRGQRDALEERLGDEDHDMDGIRASLPEDASVPEWERRARDLQSRVAAMGVVNLAAIDEFKALSERRANLDTQCEDVLTALTTLEDAIKRIDKETRTRFRQTFDQVNQRFGRLFPRIFGGGRAALALLEDDLQASGIAVIAHPPGKRNADIRQLSGGEKALTAIALLFAVMEMNPGAFCLLDEADTSLDDVNVMRYAKLLEDMSKRIQFIYVTHNKISMEVATHLVGVTMQEPGVSQLATVDFREAEAGESAGG